MKYRCCLCGKEYLTEPAAVKCVNKCGRAAQESGKMKPKHVETVVTESVEFTSRDKISKSEFSALLDKATGKIRGANVQFFKNRLELWESLPFGTQTQTFDMLTLLMKGAK